LRKGGEGGFEGGPLGELRKRYERMKKKDEMLQEYDFRRRMRGPVISHKGKTRNRVLNQAVRRNVSRFPENFMFQLTKEEAFFMARSRSQIAILKRDKNIKYLPYATTLVWR